MKGSVLCLFLVFILVRGDTIPKFLHLALTGDPTEMVVGWYTNDVTATSTVQYRIFGTSQFSNATGSYNIWKEGYGYNHFVLLEGLTPDTKYEYHCGDDLGGFSGIYTYTSAPSSPRPFTIVVYGDMGIDNSLPAIQLITERSERNEFDWIYHLGDIAYPDDHFLYFQSTWNTFFENIMGFSPSFPYMVAPGNHEYSSFDPLLYFSTRDFVVYNHRFLMPSQPQSIQKGKTAVSVSPQNMFYSFDYSNVHFVSYSTETSFPGAPFSNLNTFGDQLDWLKKDLANANLPQNRKLRPWIVVIGHRPIYSSCDGYSSGGIPEDNIVPPSNSATLQSTFEYIFMENKVDLILNGHVHSYERNYPTFNNTRTGDYKNPTSPFNIVIGNGGNMEGLENGGEADWDMPQPEWSAFRYGSDYGYAMLTFHNNTAFEWKFYRSSDNTLMDSVLVTQDRS